MDFRELMLATQANWDARTPIHAASEFYARDPSFWFAEFEWDDLGEPGDVLHLQCHLGTETLALTRHGWRAVGLDFSVVSIGEARRIAGAEAEFVCANVYDAVPALDGRTFDTIYTGKGAVCYLPDLPAWARIVHDLLRPGGALYLVEFHPVFESLDVKPGTATELLLRNHYLGGDEAVRHDSVRTYTDGPALARDTVSYQWPHGLGEVITAVAGAGLRIEVLRESPLLPWKRWPHMVPGPGGWWQLPADEPRIPLLYALRAVRET
jgi:SAM-dependent methyltransferase